MSDGKNEQKYKKMGTPNGKKRFYYSDLALEQRERFPGDVGEISGVSLEKSRCEETGIERVIVRVLDEHGASVMQKPVGSYIALEGGSICEHGQEAAEKTGKRVAEALRMLLPKKCKSILVAGLGNAHMTADALGPQTVRYLQVNHHLEDLGMKFPVLLSAIAPGVTAQTGLETFDIIHGIVREVKPDVLLVIDSLAARSAARLASTIQLSDTGITPGSGVGNHRRALSKEDLGVPVISIGVPMVVGTSTIAYDTLSSILEVMDRMQQTKQMAETIKAFDHEERIGLLKELLPEPLANLYVMAKDTDERVKELAGVLANGIMRISYEVRGV